MITVEENDSGGQTVTLTSEDSLDHVPVSHQFMLTKQVRQVFPRVQSYFQSMSSEAPVPSMKQWVKSLIDSKKWELQLHTGWSKDHYAAYYYLNCEASRSACFAVDASKDEYRCDDAPKTLKSAFKFASEISWGGFGYPGSAFYPLQFRMNVNTKLERGPKINLERAYLWGEWQADFLYATDDDQTGWYSDFECHPIGSTADGLEWYFGRLLIDESPLGPDGG